MRHQSHSTSALLSQLHPLGIKATNKSRSHNASWKINFGGLGLSHVGQIVGASVVDFQAFFSQIKTWEETSVKIMSKPLSGCV